MTRTPADTAHADQQWALTAHKLDELTTAYAAHLGDRNDDLEYLHAMFCDPTKADGETLCPIRHINTLAALLAVAIDKMARR